MTKISKLLYDKETSKTLFTNGKDICNDDDCSICYDILKNDKKLVTCPTCKNWFHEHCVNRWLQNHETCVYCRSTIWKQFGNEYNT